MGKMGLLTSLRSPRKKLGRLVGGWRMNRNMKNMQKAEMKHLPMTMSSREMMLTVATRMALLSSSPNESFMDGQKLRPFMAIMMNALLHHKKERER